VGTVDQDSQEADVRTSLPAGGLHDAPDFDRRRIVVIVHVAIAIASWGLTAFAVSRLVDSGDGMWGILLTIGLAMSGLFTALPLFGLWSWRVRAQIERLERFDPDGSAWKAMGYPGDADSVQGGSPHTGIYAASSIPRFNLFALFSPDSLTLWTHHGDRLDLVVKIPRSAAQYVARDWRRPIFTIAIEGDHGERLPISLSLTRGSIRRGVLDADSAYTTVVNWCDDAADRS
jgi:hypothetical protein